MATLDSLKQALMDEATTTLPVQTKPLSDAQYSAGFDILAQSTGYQDFIIPRLSNALTDLFKSHVSISVLEIGPGPKSILGYLPIHQRQRITRYAAFEPNTLFAERVELSLCPSSGAEPPLPCLEDRPNIYHTPFDPNLCAGGNGGKFDLILFCHSIYGMKPKARIIEKSLDLLTERPDGGVVVVFHRDGAQHLDGLVCQETATFPNGTLGVTDDDKILDCFASFIAGFHPQAPKSGTTIQTQWRKICRALGRRDTSYPTHLFFSSPEVMAVYTRHATMLPELTEQVPLLKGKKAVKSWEARRHHPASIFLPTHVQHIQQCVQWGLKHRVGMTVIGGGHSGHCLWPGVVAIDMGAFNQVHIHRGEESEDTSGVGSAPLVVAGGGCKTIDIIRTAMAAGLTVPLGSRPSVGAGLWLQGGIGHLTRLYGLACDAVVGAVVVSVNSSQVLCAGHVPSQHWPMGAVRAENEADLLWALRGAGTNIGIVVSVTFKAYPALSYRVRNWVVPVSNPPEVPYRLNDFDQVVSRGLPRHCSADAYLYQQDGKLHVGMTMFESFHMDVASEQPLSTPTPLQTPFGVEDSIKVVNGVDLFETEMYMSSMHGGHGGGRTFSFKRCLFLNGIGASKVSILLERAMATSPSPLCYIHLIQGGGAVRDLEPDATAFGCRDWDFACVVTAIWRREQEAPECSHACIEWVYNVVRDLLPLSDGVYGADLGPDPRDRILADRAFGPNRLRLAHLKHLFDPFNILAYTCPLPERPMGPQLIILVTGETCAGKDYCAATWVPLFTSCTYKLVARAASISESTKREYASATGADITRLLNDRDYKEQHRPALTAFFQAQKDRRPQLLSEHFLDVVNRSTGGDVLLITGMRDRAPVATLSHLVPHSRLLEVRVNASKATREARGARPSDTDSCDHRPCLTFENDTAGSTAATRFAEHYFLPFFHVDLQRLANMVRLTPDFPRRGIEFHHVLNISQSPDGLNLCTSLFQTHFTGNWGKVTAIASCEAGGFIFASALASRVNKRLVLIREAGKLPPPTFSIRKPTSHISSWGSNHSKSGIIEVERDSIPSGASMLVVDDVLATGETLCGVLQLLQKASVNAENISIMVVAEFPVHRGRELLRQRGFGRATIQSLLVFGGA